MNTFRGHGAESQSKVLGGKVFCGILIEASGPDQLAGEGGVLFSKCPLWSPGSLPIATVIVKTRGSTVLGSFG